MPTTRCSFLAIHGAESAGDFVDCLHAQKTAKGAWRLGASWFLPRKQTLAASRQLADDASVHADYVIADPDTRMFERDQDKRGRGRQHLSYLKGSSPHADLEKLVEATLKAQVDAHARILISPWFVHGASPGSDELTNTMECARIASRHKLAKGRTLLHGVEATWKVFASDDARNEFLDELVDLPPAPVYLRMRVSPPQARMQYRQTRPLAGLRAATEALTANERAVILPQSGLAGWLMLPFGASAFGAGMSASLQRNEAPGSGEGGGGGGKPLEWYFLPQFLSFVLADEIAALEEVEGYEACTCPFCKKHPPSPGDFNPLLAGYHFFWWCTKLAHESRGRDPATVRQRLEDAQSFSRRVQKARVTLDERSVPQHLEAWLEVTK